MAKSLRCFYASLTFLGLMACPARWDIPTAEIPPNIHISYPSLKAGPLLPYRTRYWLCTKAVIAHADVSSGMPSMQEGRTVLYCSAGQR